MPTLDLTPRPAASPEGTDRSAVQDLEAASPKSYAGSISPKSGSPRVLSMREIEVGACQPHRSRVCGLFSVLDQDDGRDASPQRALLRRRASQECCDEPSTARKCWRVPLAAVALITVAWAWSVKSGHPVNPSQVLDQAVERLRDNPALDQALESLRDNVAEPAWDIITGRTETSTNTSTTTTRTTSTTNTTTSTTSTVTTGPSSLVTFYMYRAQSDANYTTENVNTADLSGVLWYLHNEVMVLCPRKYDIVRIRRLKVTAMRPFAPFVAFDMGRCTAGTCQDNWMKWGYRVGCQSLPSAYGKSGKWFSLPGRCPDSTYAEKTDECEASKPGGGCDYDSLVKHEGMCTWHVEDAGEVRIGDVTGISQYYANYQDFCSAGGHEYDKAQDKGVLNSFWDGFGDPDRCAWRLQTFKDAFKEKYPDMPADLPAPAWC